MVMSSLERESEESDEVKALDEVKSLETLTGESNALLGADS